MHALMIHGAGGGGWEWNVWRRVFVAAGFTIAAPDLRPSASGLKATRWQDYLDQLLDENPPSSPPHSGSGRVGVRAGAHGFSDEVLIGASLGGLLALAAAPKLTPHALVLINPLPPSPEVSTLRGQSRYADVVPWARDASLAGTRRALPDADEATCRYAMRRWRDESGTVLNEARAGIEVEVPRCPVLVIASDADTDVPPTVSAALAARLGASLLRVPGSHVSPLLGRDAATHAETTVRWIQAVYGFRTN